MENAICCARGVIGRSGAKHTKTSPVGFVFAVPFVAVGYLFCAHQAVAQIVPPAPPCDTITGGGTTVNCSGDLQPGVRINNGVGPFTILNVNDLTGDIAPDPGDDGIFFRSNGEVTINADLGTNSIVTTGDNAEGVFARGDGASAITVDVNGNIRTSGNDSEAIRARSQGANDAEVTVTHTGNIKTVGVDSTGVEARTRDNDVSVTQTGNITTAGDSAHGINVQVRDGDIMVTQTGAITTTGDTNAGIFADGRDGTITVRQSGTVRAAGEDSFGIYATARDGTVDILQTGNIRTTGDGGIGILAEGRRNADLSVDQHGDITTKGEDAYGIYATASRGSIDVTRTGNIETMGDFAVGILAEANRDGSVNVKQHGKITTHGFVADAIVAYSDSGPVTVTNMGSITTHGDDAWGIFAISDGDAAVNVTNVGDITTHGDESDAINAEGNGNSPVNITTTGNITANGTDADAIDANNDTGNSTVTILGGTVKGGTGGGDGVDFAGGTDNLLFNHGTLIGPGENAVEGEGGNERIENFGTITGNVDLAGGSNEFNNNAGATFNPGTQVLLGMGNFLTNAGTLAPGGNGSIVSTMMTGGVVQTPTGTYVVDIDAAVHTNDRIDTTGTADLSGAVRPIISNPIAGKGEATILTAVGGVTDSGLGLAPTSPALEAELLYPNATDVVLGYNIDFSPVGIGLNKNQTALASYLNAATRGGEGGLNPITEALLNGIVSVESYVGALDQLSPEPYLKTQVAGLFASLDFTNALMSCQVRDGAFAVIAEDQCAWVQGRVRALNQDDTLESFSLDHDGVRYAVGAQFAVAPNWRFGLAGAYEHTNTDAARTNSDGDHLHGGLALKYQSGPVLLAAAISGAKSRHDTVRHLDFGGLAATANSKHDTAYLNGRIRAALLVERGFAYVKPVVDINVTKLSLEGFTETGAGAASLVVGDIDDTVFSASPAVEFGTEFAWSNGTIVRPYVRAGATIFSDDELRLTARLSGAPGNVAGFTTLTEIDTVVADVATGLEMLNTEGTNVRLSYDGRFGETTREHSFGAKASLAF